MALACHMRVATAEATLGFPEVCVGTIPGFGGTQRLPQLVGKGRAIELLTTGEKLGAAEAKAIGLVNYVVEYQDAMMKKCRTLLKTVMNNAPVAVGMAIQCVNAAYTPAENGYQTEANSFANCCQTEDFKEGVTALQENRKPEFKGV